MTKGTIGLLLSGFLAFTACSVEQDYDPDWDPGGPVEDGKADGLVDDAPLLEFDVPLEGDVGGDNMDLFRIELNRTDRVRIEMEVLDGDLNPHISLYLGTSTYVHSESWERDGDVLRKEYLLESTNTYFLAARAYEGEGSGRYRIRATCLGGICAGELPPPVEEEIDPGDVADCIQQARRCAFERLDRYDGAVGEVRSHLLFNECLAEAKMWDQSSCATACEYTGDDEDDDWDDAARLCESITQSLVFYADRSPECLGLLDDCMAECYSVGSDNDSSDEIYYTTEAVCWIDGFNGTCNGYAQEQEACGGPIPTDSAAACHDFCESTIGAFYDDLDMICEEAGCDENCDVDIQKAAETCGEVSAETESCIARILDDNNVLYSCEDALEAALSN